MNKKFFYIFYINYAFLCLGLGIIEIFKYPGVVEKFTSINLDYYIYLLILLALLVKPNIEYKKGSILIGSIVVLFCIGISIIESLTYPNFMLSHFHINVGGATNLALIALIIQLPYYAYDKPRLEKIALLLLGYWAIINLFGTAKFIAGRLVPMIRYPNATYDERMRKDWGPFYDCMLIIKNNTPNNATIFIPPQTDVWQEEGNEYLVRYFLYPRKIMHFEKVTEASSYINPYFVYSWGYWGGSRENGAWPYELIKSTSGKFVDNENDFNSLNPINFDRNTMVNPKTCGIIKPIY